MKRAAVAPPAPYGGPWIEAWLATEGRWWRMPFTFARPDDAKPFLERMEAENPGRAFRIDAG